jgi:AraC-like DNA-binding protein
MIFSIIEARKYRVSFQNFYSSIKGINFYWLTIVLLGFFFMWIIDFFHFIANQLFPLPREVNQSLGTLSFLTNFVFAVLIFYEGLKHPEYFHSSETNGEKPKYEKHKISKEDSDSYLIKLQEFMDKEKPYLDPDITIIELSEKTSIPMRYLSQVINDLLNQNFYDFINSYRIKESIKYLTNPAQNKMTILEILYAAGFNSKSTFYKVFRDYTGLTPTEYRKQKLAVSALKS